MNSVAEIRSPAEIYDEFFVPALFAQWGPVVSAAARLEPGERVLDVACGTGALTVAAAECVGQTGSAVGLDASPEMLAVARRKPMRIEWLEATAEALPLPDESFDAVVSQFGFMFFQDRAAALMEMMRVLRPAGRLAIAVCGAVEDSPGYSAFARLLDRLFGKTVGDAFRAPFVLGNPETLLGIAREVGISDPKIAQRNGQVRFRSIAALVSTERACVWTLGGLLNEGQFARLLEAAESELSPFVLTDGSVRFDMPALILTAEKAS
jgi:SAM-dependent methyltransferase